MIDARGARLRRLGRLTLGVLSLAGLLLAAGRVHELPAIVPGAAANVAGEARRPAADAALRLASTRIRIDQTAALWALDLSGVAGAPVDSTGWLLVAAAPAR